MKHPKNSANLRLSQYGELVKVSLRLNRQWVILEHKGVVSICIALLDLEA